MKRLLRALTVVAVLALVAVGGLIAAGSVRLAGAIEVPAHPAPPSAASPERITEGQRLADVFVCTQCHGKNLAGTDFLDGGPFMRLPAPNLTGGRFDSEQLERAVRHGIGADGRALLIMPSEAFAHMSDQDLADLTGYITTLADTPSNLMPRSVGPIGRAVATFQAPVLQPARRIEQGTAHRPVAEGAVDRYTPLCLECHGADFGGQVFSAEVDWWAPNLTDHPTGAGSWTLDQFARAMREGITPDGRTLSTAEMPWQSFALLTDDEVKTLYEFLRSRPSVDRPRPEI